MAWGVTQLALPMPHDLVCPKLISTARWLVRVLLTNRPGKMPASLPALANHGRTLPLKVTSQVGFVAVAPAAVWLARGSYCGEGP